MSGALAIERRRLRVTGTVQGVGFRPFVYRHAVALGLRGTVCNDSAGVLIEVEGASEQIVELCRLLVDQPPPLARIEAVQAVVLPAHGRDADFAIVDTTPSGPPRVPVSVDTAACSACLAEIDDSSDRRFRYPFANCTDCGPRYTIVLSVPYDRPATTMAEFTMCEHCQREYDDPTSRRFHAQPNACPVCGPRVRYCAPRGGLIAEGDDALEHAATMLRHGGILAVKGIGGFHLAADATDANAVAELRRRKHRDDKPFALMVPDLATARVLCELDAIAEGALVSPRRPIVLAARRAHATAGPAVAPGVAPGLPELGIMLPYTPLHHLLLARVARPLVLTSGNRSDEPIAHIDRDALDRLGPMVDGLLTHDRKIHIRCDDSVVRAAEGRTQVLRRSRGYAPESVRLPAPARRQVLAVGAELKNTVSVARDSRIVTSHHIGDLEHPAAYESFLQAVEHLCRLFGVAPDVIVHDLHPEYLSTKWALDTDLPTWGVQHHHAHIASCLAEHGHPGPVLGVAFDGLGYGCDRTLWGGEFISGDLSGFERVAHLRSVQLPGGGAAIREPWRMAVAWAHAAAGADAALREGLALDARAASILEMVERGAAPVTTSVGRLFDAVAALLGIRARVTYEGQAAVELEALARSVPRAGAPVYPVDIVRDGDRPILDPGSLITRVLAERDRGTPTATIAAGFHEGLGQGTGRLAAELAQAHGLDVVALSGGVFQNVRLTAVVQSELLDAELHVLVHEQVPPNDGGISVGQAAIAATRDHLPAQ